MLRRRLLRRGSESQEGCDGRFNLIYARAKCSGEVEQEVEQEVWQEEKTFATGISLPDQGR